MKKIPILMIILLYLICNNSHALAGDTYNIAATPKAEVASWSPATPDTSSPPRLRTSLKCGEDTKTTFNKSGVEVLPFLRTAFFDMDGDGRQELIAGSKDGSLRFYKNSGTVNNPSWNLTEKYFEDISAGAFSSPAVGDIDGCGRPEIILGTGGFSSDSGRVLLYKNSGSIDRPVWKKMDLPKIWVGNDATPALLDVDNDGKPDLIVGNSTGNLFLFRNLSKDKRVLFEKDPNYFKGINLGMYGMPAATTAGDGTSIIIAGNSMGKLYILEKGPGQKSFSQKTGLRISLNSFAAPSFIKTGDKESDIVISDSYGQFHLFKNRKNNYREWEKSPDFLDGRVLAGPVCSPGRVDIGRRSLMVVGNINGQIKLFEYKPSSNKLPWVERPDFFKNIKLRGFSRGVLANWEGKELLITGQQDGVIKAFLNSGTMDRPQWVEKKAFFTSIPKMMHAAPSVFDIDGDGRWELIVGDADGNVRGFRYKTVSKGMPVWESLREGFSNVKVGRFATPTIVKDSDRLILFVGEQDGRIHVFTADSTRPGTPVFYNADYLPDIRVNNHSSPSAVAKDGLIELMIGDYNGNLKHFACRKD